MLEAWSFLLESALKLPAEIEALNYDLIEVTRESLDLMLDQQYLKVMKTYFKNESESFANETDTFLDIVQDLDLLLSTNEHFMIGPWLEKAQNLGPNYEFMARNLITLWGPEGNILDYARRTWSGIVMDYYYQRWSLFFRQLKQPMSGLKKFKQKNYYKKFMTSIGLPFSLGRKKYPLKPRSDTLKTVRHLHEKWRFNFQFEHDYQWQLLE